MYQDNNQDYEREGFIVYTLPTPTTRGRARSTPIRPSQGGSDYNDSSGPLFTLYSKIAEEEDGKMTERWQQDTKGIIIFNGLFSAAVASLVTVSIQDLRPNSQDTSAFYLEKMYQLQANPSASPPSNPSTVAQPPAFSPPAYAVWVNSLWFLSLVISLSCAMLATSVQQWVRRYLRITQSARCTPHKRARLRAIFANGVNKSHVGWVVEALPAVTGESSDTLDLISKTATEGFGKRLSRSHGYGWHEVARMTIKGLVDST
ncbi:hypothetical protein BJV74DRAFT_838366 [Russula compacta]|nr:hypothetical protein BJV74DRAFT_838366 [Russula compacta]